MSEITLNVKVQGLEQLRETVALLQQLKELGAGNLDALVEVYAGGAVLPKVSVEIVEQWYPDNSDKWIEHDGKSVPKGERFHILLRSEREGQDYYDTEHHVDDWSDEFLWKGRHGDDIVAYIKVED